MATTAIKTHHFVEKPLEVAGETVTAMVCDDCGTRMDEADEGEECFGATLDEATDEVRSSAAGAPGSIADVKPSDASDGAALPPPAPKLPFPAPPFDASAAFDRICSKRHAVKARRTTWEKKAAQAKEAKQDLESEQEELEELIDQFERDKNEAQAAAQAATPRLVRPRETPTAGTLRCIFEERAGETCPLCSTTGLPFDEATRKSEEHYIAAAQVANEARAANVAIMQAAEKAGWHLELETIAGFSDDEFERLQAWVDHGGDTPSILGRPHVAAEPEQSVQCCRTCGNVLVDLTVYEPILIADRVGVDCAGAPAETVGEA